MVVNWLPDVALQLTASLPLRKEDGSRYASFILSDFVEVQV